jgi:hypothetical protein
MQRSAGRGDRGQPALDCGVDVLVGVEKIKGAGIELFADAPQPSFDGGQLCGGDDARGRETARMRDAAGDVKGVKLEIGVERR